MKNLANCTIDEFISTAVKARPLFVEWVSKTGVRDPRETIVDKITDDSQRLDRIRVTEWTIGEIMATAFEKAPDLTRELLCLATFTDPDDYGSHTIAEYYTAAMEMYNSDVVRSFFTSFVARNPMISIVH